VLGARRYNFQPSTVYTESQTLKTTLQTRSSAPPGKASFGELSVR